ncbi:MAG: hypothetical protein QOG35_1907 [Solirubrobacteraceae bacterium]|jgi:hypothetical protein|nr:hypothetical protein [Solirubrobacteraceae bacterium]
MGARVAIAVVLAVLALSPPGSALELGVQDDRTLGQDPAALFAAGHDVGARWVRIIIVPGDPSAASKIRAAHAAGFAVILTIGGTGTTVRQPSARALLATIRHLPNVERYTVINEPDLAGISACRYRAVWMRVRRVLGRRLLFGDYSPHAPLSFTQHVRDCGRIPTRLDFALHPYQQTDPLAPPPGGPWSEGGIGALAYAKRWLRTNVGVRVTFWLDEFAYVLDAWHVQGVTDEQAAAMWPGAILAARRAGAAMLGLYMAEGPNWDSRPRGLAWSVLTGHAPAPRVPLPVDDALPDTI